MSAELDELGVGGHESGSGACRQLCGEAIRQAEFVTNVQNPCINRDLLVSGNRICDPARFIDARKCSFLTKITSKHIKYFGKIDHGHAQVRPPRLGLPYQIVNSIGSRRIAK